MFVLVTGPELTSLLIKHGDGKLFTDAPTEPHLFNTSQMLTNAD